MPTLNAEVLTPDAFAAFGEVLDASRVTARVDHAARIENGRPDARPNIFMARSTETRLPHRFTKMESHPWSSQTFWPCGDAPLVLAVALPDRTGQPDLSTLRAFVGAQVGFSYHAGVWHLPVASLDLSVPVLGFMFEDGTPQDCVWADVEPSVIGA